MANFSWGRGGSYLLSSAVAVVVATVFISGIQHTATCVVVGDSYNV